MGRLSWWSAGGPSRFLERVERDVRNGKSTIVLLPPGLRRSFRIALHDAVNESFTWRSINVADETTRVHDLLHDLVGHQTNGQPITARFIASSGSLADTVVWLDNFAAGPMEDWLAFLSRYAHVSPGYGDHGSPPVFIAPLPDNSQRPRESGEVALGFVEYRGCSNNLDMEAFVADIVRDTRESILLKRTRIAVAAELAGADPDLAHEIVRWDLEVLLEPTARLANWARNIRGWDDGKQSICCHPGVAEILDGEHRTHSAAIALSGDSKEIMRRVWNGQVSVVLPFLERFRVSMLEPVKVYLPLPFEGEYRTISDHIDLELGHIVSMLRKSRAPQSLVSAFSIARRVRNSLAHLEPVSASSLRTLEQKCVGALEGLSL